MSCRKTRQIAKNLSENITLQIRVTFSLSVIFTAILWIWILPINRIDMLINLAVACAVSIVAAVKLTELILVNGTEKICQKCCGLANKYDMRMREQRRIEHENRDRIRKCGKSDTVEADIKHFIQQERGKKLYRAIRLR